MNCYTKKIETCQNNYAEWQKLDKIKYILYDFIYIQLKKMWTDLQFPLHIISEIQTNRDTPVFGLGKSGVGPGGGGGGAVAQGEGQSKKGQRVGRARSRGV